MAVEVVLQREGWRGRSIARKAGAPSIELLVGRRRDHDRHAAAGDEGDGALAGREIVEAKVSQGTPDEAACRFHRGLGDLANASKCDWPTRKEVEISSRIVRPLRMR